MRIFYTLNARSDLQGTFEYISYKLLSPIAAKAVSDKIMREIRSLESLPERNPLYKDEPWHSLGVRVMRIKNYLVLYTADYDTDTVTVARIVYGGRDINRQLEDTEEWQ